GMAELPKGQVVVVPVTRLYNRERMFRPSELMHPRVPDSFVEINSADAKTMGINNGDTVSITIGETLPVVARAHVNGGAPKGTVVLPRHLGDNPAPLSITVGSVTKS
ncbi:MAG: molybdopterin dinucleotide binding domain-containing protein, partial [Chloroflexota bacterium]